MENYGTVSITYQNQIHLPLKVREKLNIKSPSKANIYVENEKIIIEPIKENPLFSLAGKYSTSNGDKIDVDNIRDQIDYSDL